MRAAYRAKKDGLPRGVYILPNLFTTLNMFCGFYAIIAAINGAPNAAAVAILIAVIFDALDGKIARATNTTVAISLDAM